MEPQDLAEEFWSMSSEQHAEFFNIIGFILEQNHDVIVAQLDELGFRNHLHDTGERFIKMLNNKMN